MIQKKFLPKRVLGIFAHADDELIGAGGLLLKNKALGGDSKVICVVGANSEREQELLKFSQKSEIGVLALNYEVGSFNNNFQSLLSVLKAEIISFQPDYVVTHRASFDYHQDHVQLSNLVKQAALSAQTPKNYHRVEGILYTETHSLHPEVHIFVDTSDYLDIVLDLMKIHDSQNKKNNNYYLDLIQYKSQLRGLQAGCSFAEAYSYEPLSLVAAFKRENIGK